MMAIGRSARLLEEITSDAAVRNDERDAVLVLRLGLQAHRSMSSWRVPGPNCLP